MKRTLKYSSKLAAAMFAASLAFALAPVSGAQAQGQSQTPTRAAVPAESSRQASAEMSSRLQELEREVSILQREIADLKESDGGTPTIRTAAFVQPAMQQAPPESTPAAAAAPEPSKTTIASLLGGTSFSGFVDTYYGLNFNHPSSLGSGLRFFDANTNQFGLNMIELIVDKAPDATAGLAGRSGYHVSLGFGQAINTVNGSEPKAGLGFDQYLKEAYFSYLAPVGKGLQVDIGKFVTPNGAEVIETKDNWNYSRSILFYYAIPYYHFGARAAYKFNDKWSLTGYLVNGWNDVVDNSSAKTYGVSIGWSPTKKISITQNYMAGPQPEPGNFANTGDWRQLSDTVITYSPTAKLSVMVNGDYGFGDRIHTPATASTPASVSSARDWWGPAAYVKYAWSDKQNFAVRYEYFSDSQGYQLFNGFGFPDGHAQEVTTTFTHMLTSALSTRFEYRYDFANQPIFEKGHGNAVKNQHTLALGMVYTFDSRNEK
jgi:Putative beta-barrel porin-2, OmpL-like. bbp2